MSQQQFDFDTFNSVTSRIPAGLGVFLALQLMINARNSFEYFDNVARESEASEIVSSLKLLRAALKQDAAERG